MAHAPPRQPIDRRPPGGRATWWRAGLLLAALLGAACEVPPPELDLSDDPTRYIEQIEYRRGVMERDLLGLDTTYAQKRLTLYGLAGEGWDLLEERDRPSRRLSVEDTERLQAGGLDDLDVSDLQPVMPGSIPDDGEEWIALGREVVARYPLRSDPLYTVLASRPGGLERAGFLTRPDGTWVGLAVFEDEDGATRIGPTCAQCHCSGTEFGAPSPVLANKAMDLGAAHLIVLGYDPDVRPEEIEGRPAEVHYDLGPGRADVLADGEFNPLAFPDLGGLADMPYLQQNANWIHGGLATLAIRCATLFTTSNNDRSRIPRTLSWAAASFFRSFDPPAPLDSNPGPEAAAGEALFADADCAECHAPPTYTSDRLVTLEEVGTDPAAGTSPARGTGYYRIPSLRGVGRTAPYLHHGAVPTLEELLSPDREEPGHEYGWQLSAEERAQLIAFLRSI